MPEPTRREVADQDAYLLRRQREFRLAAEYVARYCSRVPQVLKVALFGSVRGALWAEVPRFREYRRAGVEVLHECKDVDLAVWLTDLGCLRELQKARSRAVNELLRERGIGVAHHQVDVFIMEPGTDRYLGRLCVFAKCPKEGREECLAPGCGATPWLAQHEDFALRPEALRTAVLLFDRSAQT